MANCFFCEAFVGEVNGDGGGKGRTIGTRDICEQCLGELKYVLAMVKEKSPSEREAQQSEDDGASNDTEALDTEVVQENESDPFSSGAKI